MIKIKMKEGVFEGTLEHEHEMMSLEHAHISEVRISVKPNELTNYTLNGVMCEFDVTVTIGEDQYHILCGPTAFKGSITNLSTGKTLDDVVELKVGMTTDLIPYAYMRRIDGSELFTDSYKKYNMPEGE